jgi:hypothetical protein
MPRKPIGDVAMTATERSRRHRARLSYAAKAKKRAQRRNAYAEQNEDAYRTCPEAVICLLHLERQHLPRMLLDAGAGDGGISKLLQRAGYDVSTCDIRDYGLPGCLIINYLKLEMPPEIEGVVANPPYKKARQFLEKALADGARYVALLVRTNFLFEGDARTTLLDVEHPPTRIWTAAPRLPMMHRFGWTGKHAPSNTPHSWAIWDKRANHREFPRRFNWRKIVALPEWRGWLPEPPLADSPKGVPTAGAA